MTYDLYVGCAFYSYLSKTDTDIFTTIKKFNDPEGKYKWVIDYQVYFIVNPDGQITTLDTRNQLNVYVPEIFGDILKKDNDSTLFKVLVLIKDKHLTEVIYRGMKDNVNNYVLKSFQTEYDHLDNEYQDLNIKALQGTIQPLTRTLFSLSLIKDGTVRRQKDFSFTNITRDRRLIALLPEKTNEFYPLSDFYNEFTNFKLTEQDFFKFDGFEEKRYRFSDRKISDIFKKHIFPSNAHQTRYVFDFLPVFKFAKSEGIGQKFKGYFFRYLSENNTEVFPTEKKYNEGKTRNIIYVVNEAGQFKFLDNEIKDPGQYWLYQYISETFYSILLKTNERLNEIYSTWYHIPKNTLLTGHLILKNFQKKCKVKKKREV